MKKQQQLSKYFVKWCWSFYYIKIRAVLTICALCRFIYSLSTNSTNKQKSPASMILRFCYEGDRRCGGDEFIHTYLINFTSRWHYHLNKKEKNRKGEGSFVAASGSLRQVCWFIYCICAFLSYVEEQMCRPRESSLTGPLYSTVKNEPLTYSPSIGNRMQWESEWKCSQRWRLFRQGLHQCTEEENQ